MASTKEQLTGKSWTKGTYSISADPTLVPIKQLISVFDSKEFYWAQSVPEDQMVEMIQNSLTFSLWQDDSQQPSHSDATTDALGTEKDSEAKFIGFARLVTDFVTFAYLTDVWVDPQCQGSGLGKWLVACVRETLDGMPWLRRSLLFTSDWERSVPFYEKIMGMEVIQTTDQEKPAIMQRLGRAHPDWKDQA